MIGNLIRKIFTFIDWVLGMQGSQITVFLIIADFDTKNVKDHLSKKFLKKRKENWIEDSIKKIKLVKKKLWGCCNKWWVIHFFNKFLLLEDKDVNEESKLCFWNEPLYFSLITLIIIWNGRRIVKRDWMKII